VRFVIILIKFYVCMYVQKLSRSGLDWSRPRADRGLSRPTSVFRTTIVNRCGQTLIQILDKSLPTPIPDRLRFGSTRAKHLFLSKNRERLCIGLAVNNNNEYICKAHFKQSSNAPLLHYQAGVKGFQLACQCLDGRRQSKLCW